MSQIFEALRQAGEKTPSSLPQDKPSASSQSVGRGKRAAVPIALALSGKDAAGHEFKEDSRTVVVTKHGMLIETTNRLSVGAELSIENRALGRKSVGKVVWSVGEASSAQASQIGLYVADAEELCGIKFSSEDGNGSSPKAKVQRAEQPAIPTPFASAAKVEEPNLKGETPQPTSPVAVEGRESKGLSPPDSVKPVAKDNPEIELTFELAKSGFTVDPEVATDSEESHEAALPSLEELTKLAAEQVVPAKDSGPPQTPPKEKPDTATKPTAQSVQTTPPIGATATDTLPAAEQMPVMAEEVMARVNQRIEGLVAAQSKLFEQRLGELTSKIIFQTETSLEQSGARLQENAWKTFQERLAPLGEQQQSSRAQVESLLARLDEAGRRNQASLEESAARVQDKVLKNVEQQVAPLGERLQGWRAQVEGLLDKVDELKKKNQADLQESAVRLQQAMLKSFEQQLAPLGERLQTSRAQVEDLLAKLERLQQKNQASLEQSAAGVQENMLKSVEQQLAPLADRLQSSRAEVEGLLAKLEKLQQKNQASLEQSAARLQENMLKSFEGRLAPLGERLENSRAQVESVLAQLEELGRGCQSETEKARATLQELTSQAVQRAVDDVNEKLRTELESVTSALVERTRERVEREGTSAEAFVEARFRNHLHHSLAELQEKGGRELEASLQKILESQRGALVDQLRKESEQCRERTLAQIQERSEKLVQTASDAMCQRVTVTGDLLKHWSNQATEQVESYTKKVEGKAVAWAEGLQKQSDEVSDRLLEKLSRDLGSLVTEIFDRFLQSARSVENTTVEAVRTKLQKSTQDLAETSAAQLQKLAEDNVDQLAEQLAEERNRLVNATTAALRKTTNDLVEASGLELCKRAEDQLDVVSERLTRKQKLITDTEQAFRQKVGEILRLLESTAGQHPSREPAEPSED